jgi:release factor glutamine methyltransferase
MKYADCYREAVRLLENNGVKEAGLDARLLLEYVCGTDRNTLLAHPEREVSDEDEARFRELLERRCKREPLQYITNEQEFMGLKFETAPDTLIPRQDTETLVEEAMKEVHDGMEILDLCCGTGCILLSLLKYSNDCSGTGVDLDEKSIELAARNAERLGLKADFRVSNLFENVEGKYDLIVSNPPYIPSAIIGTLEPEVKDYEPRRALDGGTDGLDFYKVLASRCKEYLKRGGYIFFEIGYDQKDAVLELLNKEGYKDVLCIKDLAGFDRVVKAWYAEQR